MFKIYGFDPVLDLLGFVVDKDKNTKTISTIALIYVGSGSDGFLMVERQKEPLSSLWYGAL